MRVCADKVQAYKLTFETMDNCKDKHTTLDANSALRLTPTLPQWTTPRSIPLLLSNSPGAALVQGVCA